ncbi:MAG: MFS transporter [Chloroflexota bacterium]
MPAAAGIVSDEFPRSRQRAIGLFSSIFPAGAIIGPNLGGWMVASLGWQSIFWLNVPFGLVILIMGQFLLRRGRQTGNRSIDLIGTGLLTVFLTAFMLALTEGGNRGTGIPWLLLAIFIAVGLVALFYFIRQEKRVPDPIINLELLQKRPFLGANIYNLIYGASAFGVFSLIPLYAVSVYDMPTFTSGLILTPRSVGMAITSAIMSFLLVRYGYRRPIIAGTLAIALSLFLLALELSGISVLGISLSISVILGAIMTLSGIGMGIATPAANNACIELMPDKIATITGLRGMFRQIGGAVGIALATVLLHNGTEPQRAFFFIFVGFGAILLLALPTVFLMPRGPDSTPATDKAPGLSPQPDKE